jgi:hydroxymethylpyrimidine pyrophosphatase-like HAD family hydrolase
MRGTPSACSIGVKLAAIAVDYDGTLTLDGRLSRTVLDAIGRVRCRGIRILLVTGRRLAHLAANTEIGMFDAVVAENGAVVEFPASGRHLLLGTPVSDAFAAELSRRQVDLARGECLIETDAGAAEEVVRVLRALEQPYILAFNRQRLMVLPQGIAKSTGLRRAIFELGVSMHNTIGIGDAENDHDLLAACEIGVAVEWGSPALRRVADDVIAGRGPEAVAAYIDGVSAQARLAVGTARRHAVPLGRRLDGSPASLGIRGRTLIIAGEPGSGKSQLAGLLCEQFILQRYSLAILDPEGDYRGLESLPNVTVAGGDDPAPAAREVRHALRHPGDTLIVDLSRLSAAGKREYVRTMLPVLASERRRTGLPHKIVLDEAHQFLGGDAAALIDAELGSYVWVTYRVSQLPAAVCPEDAVRIVTRESEPAEIEALSRLCGAPLDGRVLAALSPEEAALLPGPDEAHGDTVVVRTHERLTPHVRHRQKYFDAPVADAHAFVFTDRSPAVRVRSFSEMVARLAELPPAALRGYCERHDVSRWVRDVFRDHLLAARLLEIERRVRNDDPRGVADALAQAIRARYEFGAG